MKVIQEVSSIGTGEAVLQLPAELTPEEMLDVEDWLQLVIKKLNRRYAATKADQGNTGE